MNDFTLNQNSFYDLQVVCKTQEKHSHDR